MQFVNSFFYQVSKLRDKLSYSERKLIDYIANNAKEVISMPIAVLSSKTNVSSATIVSTAKKLGFSGYSELKLSLAAEQSNPLLLQSGDTTFFNSEEQSSNALQQVARANAAALNLMEQHMDYDEIQTVAKVITKSKRIFLFGEGTSDILAMEAYDFLSRLGICCIHQSDWQSKLVLIEQVTKEDVGIFFTQSGVNTNILDLADRFSSKNGFTIGISNFQKTAVSQKVDILLAPFPEPTTIHDNNYTFRIPILCILECLYYAIATQSIEYYKSILVKNYHLRKFWTLFG